jgi:hypothetical protein
VISVPDNVGHMSEVQVSPVVLAYGRFKLSEAPDGSLVAAAATDICDRCRDCGCGDQRQPYHVPGMLVKMLGSRLRGLSGDGTNGDGPAAA